MFNDHPTRRKLVNRSTAQSLRVGENPLNGKSVPLTHTGEGEDMVYSHMKDVSLLLVN